MQSWPSVGSLASDPDHRDKEFRAEAIRGILVHRDKRELHTTMPQAWDIVPGLGLHCRVDSVQVQDIGNPCLGS